MQALLACRYRRRPAYAETIESEALQPHMRKHGQGFLYRDRFSVSQCPRTLWGDMRFAVQQLALQLCE